MRIEPLEHKHRYRFRVRAVNKIGRSDPCEMLGDDILIKDPWGECHLVSLLHCSTITVPSTRYFLQTSILRACQTNLTRAAELIQSANECESEGIDYNFNVHR